MGLEFVRTNPDSLDHCEALASWQQDPYLRKLCIPQKQGRILPIPTAESIRADLLAGQNSKFIPVLDEVALLSGRVVGHLTLYINPPHRLSKGAVVAWPSLVIGEKSLRGTGILRRFEQRLLKVAREHNATHLEAGVFEFNQPIQAVLQKRGFQPIGRVENFTWAEGRGWADLRFELPLESRK